MEQKPRVNYADFVAEQKKQERELTPYTLGWLIHRYITEMAEMEHPVGESQQYSMKAIQRSAIGKIDARKLNKNDVKDYAKARTKAGVQPSTVTHDLSDISVVLKYAGSEWDDCEGITNAAVIAAKPTLTKHGIMGKSKPRERRPTPEEIERLIAHFNTPAAKGHARVIPMSLLTRWQVASGRRISESCRLLWADWNRDEQTIMVRKMKDPRTRHKDKLVALTDEAQAMLVELHATRDERQPRIFPYRSRSVVSAYCNAKKAIGIDGLHLHDSRRECGSRLVEKGFTPPEAILFTGHESTKIFEAVYMRLKPQDARHGPIATRKANG